MSALERDLGRLAAWIDEEVEARRALLGLLERQERAVLEPRPAELEVATAAVAGALDRQGASSARRRELFASLASAWRVSPQALTLASIAERATAPGLRERIDAGRGALREVGLEVAGRNRRIAALVRARRRLVGELVGLFVHGVEGASPIAAGTLVDARA